jgi:CRP/FNR family transcriptional regulator, cyclic AMP receptor protein
VSFDTLAAAQLPQTPNLDWRTLREADRVGTCEDLEITMRNDARIDTIRNVWLFERCTKKELEAIAKLATPLDLPAGKVLTTQGEQGREFFAIVSGKVEATRDGITIGTLGAGNFFGEMSLLELLPRVATIRTIEPTSVLVLTAQAFNTLVASMPSVDRNMMIVLAHRLRDIEDAYVPADARLVSAAIT